LKDLASAHEIEVCRIINEYCRLLSAIKKAIGIRKDAKKRFTESIAVKLEKYRQYNCAMEAFASTDKIAKKLDAYNDAKRDMLENRQVHLQISKNLIHDFHRYVLLTIDSFFCPFIVYSTRVSLFFTIPHSLLKYCRFMRAKEIDLKKIAVDVLTFNVSFWWMVYCFARLIYSCRFFVDRRITCARGSVAQLPRQHRQLV
jgi:hypothetical protein